MIIDVHTHIVPEHFLEAGGRSSAARWPSMDHFQPGSAKLMVSGKNFRTLSDVCWDADRRVQRFSEEGVDAQVISPMPELLSYWFTPEDGLDMSRYVNEAIATMVQAHPGRFYGLGMVPLQDPALAVRELERIQGAGLLGVELGSNILGKSLGEAQFQPFFEEVDRLGMSVFVHALHPTFTDRFPADGQLVNAIGFPTDTGLTIASIIAGKTMEACPNLRLAFSHGGGTFPSFLPRLQHAWSGRWNDEPPKEGAPKSSVRELLPRSPADYARMFYYDALVFDRRSVSYLIDLVGSSQVMAGTDFPFVPRQLPLETTTLPASSLSPEDLEAIKWKNCLRFLGLPVPKAG